MKTRIVIKVEGDYPWAEKFPERTQLALVEEILAHMKAYGLTELSVTIEARCYS